MVKSKSSQNTKIMNQITSPGLPKAGGKSSVLQGFAKPPPSKDTPGKAETGLWGPCTDKVGSSPGPDFNIKATLGLETGGDPEPIYLQLACRKSEEKIPKQKPAKQKRYFHVWDLGEDCAGLFLFVPTNRNPNSSVGV